MAERPGTCPIVLILLALAFPAKGTAAEKQTVTRLEARTLPAKQLADRLLGAAGKLYSEMERPSAQAEGMFAAQYPQLTSLRFASQPRSAGYEGLCEIDTIFIELEAREGEPPAMNSDVSVRSIRTNSAFRFIGSQAAGHKGAEVDWKREEERCRTSKPVFSEASPTGSVFFFGRNEYTSNLDAVHATFALRAMQIAQERSEAAPPIAVLCQNDPAERKTPLCSDAGATLRQLQPGDTAFAEVRRCEDVATTYCTTLTFHREGSSALQQKTWRVHIATAADRIEPPPPSLAIRSVLLSAHTIVD
jgi:hypothetical protein